MEKNKESFIERLRFFYGYQEEREVKTLSSLDTSTKVASATNMIVSKADKDIIVVKPFQKEGEDLLEIGTEVIFQKGLTYEVEGEDPVTMFKPSVDFESSTGGFTLNPSKGIICFENEESLVEKMGSPIKEEILNEKVILKKCVIPKGSFYIKDHKGTIVSATLKLKKKDDK